MGDGSGNREAYRPRPPASAPSLGGSPATSHANGPPGMSSSGHVMTNPYPIEYRDAVKDIEAHAATILTIDFEEPENTNPLPALPETMLDLNIADENFKSVDVKAFSEQRPEIIAQFDFAPAFSDDMIKSEETAPSAITEMLDLQISARQLRTENIIRLLNELKVDDKTKQTISELERRLTVIENSTERESRFLDEIVKKIADGKRSLSIKSNESWIKNDIISRDEQVSNEPIKRIMVDLLGFSEDGYKSFSDTKIMLNMIDDLRHILKSFSPQLINRQNRRRINDRDPYVFQKIDDSTGGAPDTFSVESIKSRSSAEIKDSLVSGTYKFQDSIRVILNPEDRLKMLFGVLSKELRVSVGLSIPAVRSIATNVFGLDQAQIDSDIFGHILGEPGTWIFDKSNALPNAIVNLFKVETDAKDGKTIFPFETSFIQKGSKITIPGQKFYVESILRGPEKFKTKPFENFAVVFNGRANAFANIIEGTLDVNVVNKEELGLNAKDLMIRFFRSIKSTINEFQTTSTKQDTFFVALLRLAADDVYLKHMLYLYISWVGVSVAAQQNITNGFFGSLADAGDFRSGLDASKHKANSALASDRLNAIYDAIQLLQPSNQIATAAVVPPDLAGFPTSLDVTGDSGLDIISKMIIDRVFTLIHQDRQSSTSSGQIASIIGESSASALNRLTTLGESDVSFIFRSIVEFTENIDRLARNPLQGDKYFSTSKPGLTKFNNLGAHTMLQMIIEMYTTFFKMFPVAVFMGAEKESSIDASTGQLPNTTFFSIKDVDLIEDVKIMLDELIPDRGPVIPHPPRPITTSDQVSRDRQLQLQRKIDQFKAMSQKFQDEDNVVKSIVNVIIAIGNGLLTASADLTRFFDQNSSNKAIFDDIKQSVDFNEKMSTLNLAQVTLSRNVIAEQRATRASSIAQLEVTNDAATRVASLTPFVDDTTISPNVRVALLSMLKSPTFISPGADNLRIISVGLPAGFMDSLQERIGTFIVGQNIREYNQRLGLQSNVIRINVYMKDLLFEDVVFKPKSFIFETSRFVSMPDFAEVTPNDQRSFELLVDFAIRSRVLSLDGSKFLSEKGINIASDKSYEGVLAYDEKIQLAINHVTSYLLRVYLKLLTGVDFSEENFYMNDAVSDLRVDSLTQDLFETLITTRVSAFAGRKVTLDELKASNNDVKNLLSRLSDNQITAGAITSIAKVLEDASKAVNIEISNDLITFMKVFSPSAVLFGAGARRVRATSPKLFERIFNVVVDPDDFEIDDATTQSTVSGQAFMGSTIAKKLLRDESPDRRSTTRRVRQGLKFDPARRREIGNVSLQQFFVSIEQVPELQPLTSISTDIPLTSNPASNQRQKPQSDSAVASKNSSSKFESGASTKTNKSQDANRKSLSPDVVLNEGINWSKIL